MTQTRMWLAAALLACLAQTGAAAAAVVFTPLAHSAQLTLETARTSPTELTLRLERTQGTAALAVTALTVSIDGRNAAATPRGDNTWSVVWPAGAAVRDGKLEAVVTHDGIQEVLSGTLLSTATSGGGAEASHGLLGNHKQLAWWILNIAVVLIAAIAISRRTS